MRYFLIVVAFLVTSCSYRDEVVSLENLKEQCRALRADILKLNAKKLPKTITVLSDECNEQGW